MIRIILSEENLLASCITICSYLPSFNEDAELLRKWKGYLGNNGKKALWCPNQGAPQHIICISGHSLFF